MNKTTVIILGVPIPIVYRVHDPAYVEWAADYPKISEGNALDLLNIILRTHYNEYITGVCREQLFYDNYAHENVADEWADSLRYTKDINKIFNNEDIPF